MASLSTSITSGSVSSLLKSSASIQSAMAANADAAAGSMFLDDHSDNSYATYSAYLINRIDHLSSTGSIADATHAISLGNTLRSAQRSNVSFNISNASIAVMDGQGSLTDKYNLLVNYYGMAQANGDTNLAQSLMSQAYSTYQSIQIQNQQAASAASALLTAKATAEGDIVTNLKGSIGYFEGLAKNASQNELNKAGAEFVKNNKATFDALGVSVSTSPNYFDVVHGLVGAIYNHTVLEAQAKTLTDTTPGQSQVHALSMSAANILNGATKFQTLGGNLTFQEIQQASADPSMFAYDSSTGSYKKTTQSGYQYETFSNPDGTQYKALAPTYTGLVGGPHSSQVFFLTPNETKTATNLGLTFTDKDVNGKVGAGKQVGAGVQVQLSENSPEWLQAVLGKNGVTKLFTDPNGDIVFSGAASSGAGSSYYTLVTDGKGLPGLFEHSIDGTTKLAGGSYGFNAGAAQLLINDAQTVQRTISLQQQMNNTAIAQAATPKLPSISTAPAPPPPSISTPKISSPAITPPTINPQKTAPSTVLQKPISVQTGGNTSLQGGGFKLQ